MNIVNLTPHAIRLADSAGQITMTLPPSGQVARVGSTAGPAIEGLPFPAVAAPTWGAVEGLPAPEEGVIYIVSALVAGRCPERGDVFSPGTGPGDNPVRLVKARPKPLEEGLPVIHSTQELSDLVRDHVERGEALYVRHSHGPDNDKRRGWRSMNWFDRNPEPGLSVWPMHDPEDNWGEPAELAAQGNHTWIDYHPWSLQSALHLVRPSPKQTIYLLRGERVRHDSGEPVEGSDSEPLLKPPITPVAILHRSLWDRADSLEMEHDHVEGPHLHPPKPQFDAGQTLLPVVKAIPAPLMPWCYGRNNRQGGTPRPVTTTGVMEESMDKFMKAAFGVAGCLAKALVQIAVVGGVVALVVWVAVTVIKAVWR